jgi:methyl-accepting chemotaxis protein
VIHSNTSSSSKVKILVDEVNLGSQEQARGIEQISKAVTQMDQVTQGTAANAEESASASEELSAQAEAMKHIVLQLQTMVGGNGQETVAERPRAAVRKPATRGPVGKPSLSARTSSPSQPAPAAGSFPLEDNFMEM